MPGEDLRPFIAILTALLLPVVTGQSVAQAQSPTSVEHIVAQKVQPMLPEDASSGVAVAVRIDGKTEFFNFGTADRAKNRPVTADSVFNLASVGKIFATTLLAQAVKRGELGLDDPVAKYITKLQQGGDIRRVTLGQLASHTSGLPRVPEQYERWHNTLFPISSASSIPGKPTTNTNRGSSISIPMPRWCCCGSRSSAASNCRSRP
jgi:CubicO group peptidase (beta-lactamase class C family)